MGVRSVGAPLTGREAADASLLLPDGPGGRALLVFDNFRATMKWNKSVKFAASVGMIADGVGRGKTPEHCHARPGGTGRQNSRPGELALLVALGFILAGCSSSGPQSSEHHSAG